MQGNKVCDEYCKGCGFMGHMGGDWLMHCKYLFMEGKPRPCPPGTGCTEKRTARSGKGLTIDGETKCVTEWAEITGISKYTIYDWCRKHGRKRTEQKVIEVWKGRNNDG